MGQRIDRQAAFSGTKPVPDALAFDAAALTAYLVAHVEGFSGPAEIVQFKGGQSNPTYRVTAASGTYVLRRKPPGKLLPSAHAIEREYRVMAALGAAGFPVPAMRVLCEDPDVIGTAFYLMDHVAGRVIWEPSVPDAERQERAAIYDAMNATLARLHSYDPEAIGLGDFGRAEGYVARQIARWSKNYSASQTAEIAEMDRLMNWLPGQVPEDTGAAVVHGDYRLDNMILHPTRPQVLAVLDWELSTLGDPIADFTYHLMQWVMPPAPDGAGVGSLRDADLAALGIPDMDAYVATYCDRTGRDGIADLDFYLAYNFFRMAAIFQGIVGRVRDGTATNENAAAMEGQVRPMAETAWAYARRAGARG